MSAAEVEASIAQLDFPTPCLVRIQFPGEQRAPKCDQLATWILRCRVCGYALTSCGEHRARILVQAKMRCRCGTLRPPETLFSFLPIGLS